MSIKRALVVDLSYQVHRYLSVPKMAELRTKDKVKVGGVYGVLKALESAMTTDVFTKVICCMDSYPAFRKQLFPSYKSSRRSNPDSPEYQDYVRKDAWGWSQKSTQDFTFNTLKILLPKMKIPTLIQENVEGDDLVYHTCKQLTEDGWSCTAMSDDRDYLQLINLVPNLKIYRVIKGDVITSENFYDRIGVHPEWFIIYKALMGDPSDEIPSAVKGFGETSIIKFVNEAYNRGIQSNSATVFNDLINLAQNWSDKKTERYIKKFTEDALIPLKKNLQLMDFRLCPYGKNKLEDLKESLNKTLDLDGVYVKDMFQKLEFKSMMSLIQSPLISRLT